MQLDWRQIEVPDLRTGVSEPFSDSPPDALGGSSDDGCSASEIVANRHISPPVHHESRTERQEHQHQNGYYALGLSLSQTHRSNYETCVLHEPSPL